MFADFIGSNADALWAARALPPFVRDVCAAPPFRALWVDTFPQCVRNDAFVWGFGDWRTPARIAAYNAAGQRAVRDGGHVGGGRAFDAYVAVHAMLRQLCDVCPDGAHFIDVFPVLDFLTALLLRHLGGEGLFNASAAVGPP